MNLNFVVYSMKVYDENHNIVASIERVSTSERQYRVIVLGNPTIDVSVFGSLDSVKNFVRGKLGDGR